MRGSKASILKSAIFLVLLLASLGSMIAEEPVGTAQFSQYDGIYLIGGYADIVYFQTIDWSMGSPVLDKLISARQLFKLQFSVKFQLFNEEKSGLFIGYTQKMFWNLMGESSPLLETDYNPELFWRLKTKDNFMEDADFGLFDHVQVGIFHESTGVAGAESRAYDKAYIDLGVGIGEELRLELSGRYSVYFYQVLPHEWYAGETLNIQDTRSNMEFGVSLAFADEMLFFVPQKVTVKGAPGGGYNGFDWTKGYVEAEVSFGSFFGGLSPFAQFFYGYGEGLINQDERVMSLRFGITAR
jgi:phospholipase A1